MSKLNLNMGLVQCLTELSQGNPGAITAIVDCMKYNPEIDPDDVFGEFGPIIALDNYKIYGTDIYVLWNDICDRNSAKMITLLRAVQLGELSRTTLQIASRKQDRSGKDMIDFDSIYTKVKEFLTDFDKEGLALIENE